MVMFIFRVNISKIYFGKFKSLLVKWVTYGIPFPMDKNVKQGEVLEQGFSILALLRFWAK